MGNDKKINIEVFSSPGCAKCGHTKDVLHKLVNELGSESVSWREVNILEETDYAVELGVLSTPAIAIDGELIFSSLPSTKKLQKALASRLASENSAAG